MTTYAAGATADPPILWRSEGVSAESEEIKSLIKTYTEHLRKSTPLALRRASLLDEVSQISQTCTDRGWDGYDAEPISVESANGAVNLLEILPEGIQTPNVVPEPTGDISFEWRTEGQKHFSVSVTGQTLVYAGIFGGLPKHYGEERFFGVIPRTILEILVRYFPEA